MITTKLNILQSVFADMIVDEIFSADPLLSLVDKRFCDDSFTPLIFPLCHSYSDELAGNSMKIYKDQLLQIGQRAEFLLARNLVYGNSRISRLTKVVSGDSTKSTYYSPENSCLSDEFVTVVDRDKNETITYVTSSLEQSIELAIKQVQVPASLFPPAYVMGLDELCCDRRLRTLTTLYEVVDHLDWYGPKKKANVALYCGTEMFSYLTDNPHVYKPASPYSENLYIAETKDGPIYIAKNIFIPKHRLYIIDYGALELTYTQPVFDKTSSGSGYVIESTTIKKFLTLSYNFQAKPDRAALAVGTSLSNVTY